VLVEPLTAREQEVLRRFSGMLNTAEVATEMYHLGQHRQDPPQEHLPQAGGDAPQRGDPPGPAAQPDLTRRGPGPGVPGQYRREKPREAHQNRS
jgi:hypothetical protein